MSTTCRARYNAVHMYSLQYRCFWVWCVVGCSMMGPTYVVLEHALFYAVLQEVLDMWHMAEEATRCNDDIKGSAAAYMNIANAIQRLPPVCGWVGWCDCAMMPIRCLHALVCLWVRVIFYTCLGIKLSLLFLCRSWEGWMPLWMC